MYLGYRIQPKIPIVLDVIRQFAVVELVCS